jgi:hypothetical protein
LSDTLEELPFSFCSGDQGFLNAYYPDFISNPLFDPKVDYRGKKIKSMLLPTRYNADIGLYIANSNRWMLTGELKVMHFTLGSFKPWDWWCGWLIKEQARWHVRSSSSRSSAIHPSTPLKAQKNARLSLLNLCKSCRASLSPLASVCEIHCFLECVALLNHSLLMYGHPRKRMARN